MTRWDRFLETAASWKWLPIDRMSDQEYETYLQERIIKADAEIALIDDRIASVKAKVATPSDGQQDT